MRSGRSYRSSFPIPPGSYLPFFLGGWSTFRFCLPRPALRSSEADFLCRLGWPFQAFDISHENSVLIIAKEKVRSITTGECASWPWGWPTVRTWLRRSESARMRYRSSPDCGATLTDRPRYLSLGRTLGRRQSCYHDQLDQAQTVIL